MWTSNRVDLISLLLLNMLSNTWFMMKHAMNLTAIHKRLDSMKWIVPGLMKDGVTNLLSYQPSHQKKMLIEHTCDGQNPAPFGVNQIPNFWKHLKQFPSYLVVKNRGHPHLPYQNHCKYTGRQDTWRSSCVSVIALPMWGRFGFPGDTWQQEPIFMGQKPK